jgi:CRP-like cAMP-binding protein
MVLPMDMNSESAALLRRNYLFAGLPPDRLEGIIENASVVTVQVGQMLFNRGDPARHFFLVLDGRIELSVVSPTGDKKIIDVIGPGNTFAEAIMFQQQNTFPVCAFGMEDSRLVKVENQPYLEALRTDAEACLVLLGDVCRRLHWQLQEIENLSITNATHRLVRFLLDRLEMTGDDRGVIDLEMSRQAIAARLSVKPETLSRLLRRLVDGGILGAEGRCLNVISVAGLKQFE